MEMLTQADFERATTSWGRMPAPHRYDYCDWRYKRLRQHLAKDLYALATLDEINDMEDGRASLINYFDANDWGEVEAIEYLTTNDTAEVMDELGYISYMGLDTFSSFLAECAEIKQNTVTYEDAVDGYAADLSREEFEGLCESCDLRDRITWDEDEQAIELDWDLGDVIWWDY